MGIAAYVGVDDSEVHILYNSLAEGIDNTVEVRTHYDLMISEAYSIGRNF